MRDYPNGGFFFIDVAPIIAAGEDGLKIDGIFEDAKRATEGGKVFVLTGMSNVNNPVSGMCGVAIAAELGVTINADFEASSFVVQITSEDVVTITE